MGLRLEGAGIHCGVPSKRLCRVDVCLFSFFQLPLRAVLFSMIVGISEFIGSFFPRKLCTYAKDNSPLEERGLSVYSCRIYSRLVSIGWVHFREIPIGAHRRF